MSDKQAGPKTRSAPDGGPGRAGARGSGSAGKAVGSQTLSRGLRALELVAGQPQGLAVQDVAECLGVHRTIAYRILVTLAEHHLVVKAADGRYRAGSGTVTLARGYAAGVREAALPVLRRTADELGATVALIAAEGNDAVAVAVVEPRSVDYHIGYRVGSRHPIGTGAAGLALATLRLPAPGEPAEVAQARDQGYARTFGRIEPGAHGVAVPLRTADPALHMCVNLITSREDVADGSVSVMRAVAEEISALG
ncbi:IclR family transcriptional regulator [Streptomyces nitrosporeus]|uniref:IclR family transcriptional regulator n=1 Tax=Streptomyces nitrosporeus TaxID=28894 RepID=A0A5J6F6F3_9ACTN|nr:helix-turn-helix domain-containing protein [Streptomyces nitrosporeus]QEU71596.1 IclR family transcriptional regulator [Streptomyces nitrosporeus]GGZ11651.1 transcriptional regulator [Streptomyces nitrosporeus]